MKEKYTRKGKYYEVTGGYTNGVVKCVSSKEKGMESKAYNLLANDVDFAEMGIPTHWIGFSMPNTFKRIKESDLLLFVLKYKYQYQE
jgi:hypothetical protein